MLLDVREPWEFETARIEGAKNIPMGDVPARAHQELDPEDHIVVVCHHGVRSLTVTNWLRQQGFEKVAVHARRNRRLGAYGRSEGAVVLKRASKLCAANQKTVAAQRLQASLLKILSGL